MFHGMGLRIPFSISDNSIVTIKSLYSVLIVHIILCIHCRLEIGKLLVRLRESHWLICYWMIGYITG